MSVFDRDISENQDYLYATSEQLSKRLSNQRSTRGIEQAACFPGRRVLDIGCGDGTFTLDLARTGAASVLGVDPASEAISRAQKKASESGLGNVSFEVRNIYDLDTKTMGQFDIVVLRGVLHHLSDPKAAVNIAVALADQVVILEPNGANPVLKLIERFSTYHREHEEQSFLPTTVKRWLRDAGAEIRSEQLINLVPLFCPAPAARLLKWLEPVVERIPGIRLISAGQFVVSGSRTGASR